MLCVGVLLLIGGCAKGPAAPTGPKSVAPTPITRLNADALVLARVDFCTLVPAGAIQDAVGGSGSVTKKTWRNGDRAEVGNGVSDVVHEFGCSWSRGGDAASAWIFARSVSPAYAGKVLAKTSHRQGCTASTGPHFGTPSQRQVCRLADGSHRVRDSGLFGDTWLTCQVSGPAGETSASIGKRADAWCVQVANATSTRR